MSHLFSIPDAYEEKHKTNEPREEEHEINEEEVEANNEEEEVVASPVRNTIAFDRGSKRGQGIFI